jgi:hypothetical protein
VPNSPFSRTVLNIGFLAALLLAAGAFLLAAYYLQRYADSTQAVVNQMLQTGYREKPLESANLELLQNGLGVHTYVARVLLVSCGMFVALAFGFLGFALFLVGASGDSNVQGEAQGLRLSLTSLAPGTITILAAAILAGICASRPLPVDLSFGGVAEPHGTSTARADQREDPVISNALRSVDKDAP